MYHTRASAQHAINGAANTRCMVASRHHARALAARLRALPTLAVRHKVHRVVERRTTPWARCRPGIAATTRAGARCGTAATPGGCSRGGCVPALHVRH